MRRAALPEWGAIFASALALALFFYWAISSMWQVGDFELYLPLGHWNTTQILASQGAVTINDRYGSLESLEFIEAASFITPLPTGKYRWSLPGIQFRCVTWPDGPPIWSIKVSLLIPLAFTSAVAALCSYGYFQFRRSGQLVPRRKPDRAAEASRRGHSL